MSRYLILCVLALAVAAGVACGEPPPVPTTTPVPELALVAIETSTPTPTRTPGPTATPAPTPTPLPTSTPTPTPVPPLASYTVDVETGSAPLTVEFDNTSEGPIASVEWDFGDGATSSDESPRHRYTITGTYSVKLAVSGPGGTDTRSVSDLITVLPGPAASLEVSPSTATLTVQHAVEFSALVRDEFGNVVDDAVVWATTAGSGSIDENGLFSAGTVSGAFANAITASLRTDVGELTDMASVTLEPGPPSEAVVEPGEITLEIGGSQDFRVEVFDEFGNGITDALVSWKSNAGTIDSDGNFNAGTEARTFAAGIEVEAVRGTGRATATTDVSIEPDPLAELGMQWSPTSVGMGEPLQLTAVASDDYGNTIPDLAFLWEAPLGGSVDDTGAFTLGDQEGRYDVTVRASYKNSEKSARVVVYWDDKVSHFNVALPPVWIPLGNMSKRRAAHTATLLPNGQVLIVGGFTAMRSSELYEPVTGTFSSAGQLSSDRQDHTATLLPDGKVLIVGSDCRDLGAELYNPESSTFMRLDELHQARWRHTATLLDNGKVLIAGGVCGGFPNPSLGTAESYDPATGTFSLTSGNMVEPRANHKATLLPNGEVLLAGGLNFQEQFSCAETVELYDPVTDTFRETRDTILAEGCGDETATAPVLPDGRILLTLSSPLSRLELYNPVTEEFTPGSRWKERLGHTVNLLPSGLVLIAGGHSPSLEVYETGLLYDPVSDTLIPTFKMTTSRVFHTATLLPTGEVLVTGGQPTVQGEVVLRSAELFIP